MPDNRSAASLTDMLAPWGVMATGVFITACAKRLENPIFLLRKPVQFKGEIVTQGQTVQAQIDIPKWFPIKESVLRSRAAALTRRCAIFP